MKFIQFTLSLLILFISNTSFAQEKTISGKIVDESGKPLSSVSIRYKKADKTGSTSSLNGTMSKEDGTYRTLLTAGFDSLTFTRIGFETVIEKIDGNNLINIKMVKEIRFSSITMEGTHKYSQAEIDETKPKNKSKLNPEVYDEPKFFQSVEIYAEYVGGEYAIQKYFKNNISYPDSATISDVNGTVKVGFTIDKVGLIKNVVLLKGVNKFADDAVIAALSKMPKWRPALQNGLYIEQYREVSVAFNIVGRVD